MRKSKNTVRLLVTNFEAAPCTVAFEPEGATVSLPYAEAFTVEIRGPGSGIPEVSYQADGISICAWPGADTTAWNKAGERLDI
jgi:hypothetical protein